MRVVNVLVVPQLFVVRMLGVVVPADEGEAPAAKSASVRRRIASNSSLLVGLCCATLTDFSA